MITVELVEPAGDAFEGGGTSDVVDDEGADGAAIIGGGDSAEPLLAGGVPNLSFDFFAVQIEALSVEFDADCGFRVHTELVASVSR